jgi:hypothetical protein
VLHATKGKIPPVITPRLMHQIKPAHRRKNHHERVFSHWPIM